MGNQYVHEENITIPQGTDFSTTITISDSTGDALNLSNISSATCMMKSGYDSSSGSTMGISIDNATSGIISLSIAAVDTDDLRYGWKVYDILGLTSGNELMRLAQGKINLTPKVT